MGLWVFLLIIMLRLILEGKEKADFAIVFEEIWLCFSPTFLLLVMKSSLIKCMIAFYLDLDKITTYFLFDFSICLPVPGISF